MLLILNFSINSKKGNVARCSQAFTNPSTNFALASVIEQELILKKKLFLSVSNYMGNEYFRQKMCMGQLCGSLVYLTGKRFSSCVGIRRTYLHAFQNFRLSRNPSSNQLGFIRVIPFDLYLGKTCLRTIDLFYSWYRLSGAGGAIGYV